jgi:hypothetical protein
MRLLYANPLNLYLINSSMLPNLKRDTEAASRFTSSMTRLGQTRNRTGRQHRPVPSGQRCACIGPSPT